MRLSDHTGGTAGLRHAAILLSQVRTCWADRSSLVKQVPDRSSGLLGKLCRFQVVVVLLDLDRYWW